MAKDVLITPASGLVEFKDTSVLKASVYETGGNLYINSQTGSTVYGDGTYTQLKVLPTASSVNYVQVTGAITGNNPVISAQGSDANLGIKIQAKGNGVISLEPNAGSPRFTVQNNTAQTDIAIAANSNPSLRATNQSNQVNWFTLWGNPTGLAPQLGVNGTDANISMALQPKGTGAIDLAAGSSGVNISNGGTVTSLTVITRGTGYTAYPTITISAPTTAGGVQATATSQLNLASAILVSGGTGYTVNDVLTFSGITGTAPTIRVDTVSGGVITGFTITGYGAGAIQTPLPSNPVSVTGGTGTGATFTTAWNLGNITITNAGSGYVEQPTVTVTGAASNATLYATVGSTPILKSTAGALSFNVAPGEAFRISNSSFPTLTDYIEVQGGGSVAGAYLGVGGSSSVASLYLSGKGGSAVDFFTNGHGIARQFRVNHTASAVNYVQVTGAATTSGPQIYFTGSDTNVVGVYNAKGAGAHAFYTNSNPQFRINDTASAVNYISVQGASTGNIPSFFTQGSDTNVGMTLSVKGNPTGPGFRIQNQGGTNICAAVQVSILNPVNYPYLQPAATGSGPTFSANGSDTNIDLNIASKGTGSINLQTGATTATQFKVLDRPSADVYISVQGGVGGVSRASIGTAGAGSSGFNIYNTAGNAIRFQTNGNGTDEQFVITHTASSVNSIQVTGAATGAGPVVSVTGSDANIPLLLTSKGTSAISMWTNGNKQFQVADTASAVNYLQVTGAVTGGAPTLSVQGSDSNAELRIRSKGIYNIILQNGAGNNGLVVDMTSGATLANYFQMYPKVTGSAPVLGVLGSDTNIDLQLTPKGTGVVKIDNGLSITGTLALTSTTLVSNLNADQLDGQHGSYYSDYRNLTNKPFTYAATPPASPAAGDKWVDSDTGIEYTYINDGDSSHWVDLSSNSAGTPVFIQSAAPNYSGGPYMWIQTGINGTGFTFWVEDGQ